MEKGTRSRSAQINTSSKSFNTSPKAFPRNALKNDVRNKKTAINNRRRRKSPLRKQTKNKRNNNNNSRNAIKRLCVERALTGELVEYKIPVKTKRFKTIQMIGDTGASVSVVSSDVIEKGTINGIPIADNQITKIRKMPIDTPNDQIVSDRTLNVRVRNKYGISIPLKLYVCPSLSDPFLLGINDLKNLGFTLNSLEMDKFHEMRIETRGTDSDVKTDDDDTIDDVKKIYVNPSTRNANPFKHKIDEKILQSVDMDKRTTPFADILDPNDDEDFIEESHGKTIDGQNVEFDALTSRTLNEILCHIDDEELRTEIHTAIYEERYELIALHREDVGLIKGHDFPINLKPNAVAFQQKPYKLPYVHAADVRLQIEHLLAEGIIVRSYSNFASPVLLVRKPDGTYRMCVDYRRLNHITLTDAFPMPSIDDILTKFKGKKWFSKFDVRSAYHHIQIRESDRHKTAFITESGLYEFARLTFGLRTHRVTFKE